MDRRTVLVAGLGLVSLPSQLRAAVDLSTALPERLADMEHDQGLRVAPARAPARWLVVLLHGGGQRPQNMLSLAQNLQTYLPDAAYAMPFGPYPRANGGGSWFPDGLMIERGLREGGSQLNAFISAELAHANVPPERLILMGFSVGSIMSLNTGLRRNPLPAAIVGFGGGGDGWELVTNGLPRFSGAPPVMLIAGSEDPAAPSMPVAVEKLKGLGVTAQSQVVPGLGHAIDARNTALAGEFARTVTERAGG